MGKLLEAFKILCNDILEKRGKLYLRPGGDIIQGRIPKPLQNNKGQKKSMSLPLNHLF